MGWPINATDILSTPSVSSRCCTLLSSIFMLTCAVLMALLQLNSLRYRAQMLLWSVLGAPLILGADIRNMDAFTKSLITAPEVLAVNADRDCVQGSLLRSRGSYEVWAKPLSKRVDKKPTNNATRVTEEPAPAIAVVLFNKGDVNTTATLVIGPSQFSSDFYPAQIRGAYEVRDLLAQKDLGIHRGNFIMEIPPQDAVMLQIVAVQTD